MNKQRITNGLILIFVGIVFLLNRLGYVDFAIIWHAFDLWPIGLIFVGISVMFRNQWVKLACVAGFATVVLLTYIFVPDFMHNLSVMF